MAYRNLSPWKPIKEKLFNYFDLLTTAHIIIPPYEDPLTNRNSITEILNETQGIKIYTDASKSSDGTGCAYYIPEMNIARKYKLHYQTSIFNAEAIGIAMALETVLENNIQHSVLLSDSLSVLTNIQSPPKNFENHHINQIRAHLYNLNQNRCKVVFIWVKAHIGVTGNEKVDKLAKDSILNGETILYYPTCEDFTIERKTVMNNKWSNHWKSFCENHHSQYTHIQTNIPKTYWFKNFNYSRKQIVTIIRLKTGHACYAKHLNRIGILHSKLCDTCNEEEDLDHIFFKCRKYSQGQKLYNKLLKEKVDTPFNLAHLLAYNKKTIYDCLLGFVRENKLKL